MAAILEFAPFAKAEYGGDTPQGAGGSDPIRTNGNHGNFLVF